MRIHSTPPEKPVNLLGESYLSAKKTSQLRFKAAMIDAGERDGWNYWRSFRDVWRFEKQLGKIPFSIICLAIEHIGYEHPKPESKKETV